MVKSAGQKFVVKAVKHAWSIRWEHFTFIIKLVNKQCCSCVCVSKAGTQTLSIHMHKKCFDPLRVFSII